MRRLVLPALAALPVVLGIAAPADAAVPTRCSGTNAYGLQSCVTIPYSAAVRGYANLHGTFTGVLHWSTIQCRGDGTVCGVVEGGQFGVAGGQVTQLIMDPVAHSFGHAYRTCVDFNNDASTLICSPFIS